MKPITRWQREALKRVYDRQASIGLPNVDEPGKGTPTYRQFRRKAIRASFDDCIMVQYAGMWLGIEPDGYTHS